MDPNENSQAPDAPDARKMNDIRLRRLAKLGSSTRSPKPEDGSTNPEKDAETPTAATTSDGKGKSAAEVTPSSTPKPDLANPFSQLGVRSTTGASPTTESGAQKRASSKMDDRAPAPAPAKKANLEESVDEFSDRVLSHIFRVAVDPERLTDIHGHKLNLLSEASRELKENGSPLKLTTAVLDSALLEAVTAVPADKPILGYLLPCFKRIIRSNVVKETPEKREVLEEAKRLCISNCLFALTIPDLFGRSQPESLVPYLLR